MGVCKIGHYETRQKSESGRKYYRFLKPENKDYPSQLELFARNPDLLDLSEDVHLTPIPVDEDLSSLSAILMNDDYYIFAIENSRVENDLRVAGIESLICLKAKAFLDLRNRKEKGEGIDKREVRKHKNDVIRLAIMLTEAHSLKLPESIARDMKEFMKIVAAEPPDYKSLAKTIGISKINGESIAKQIKTIFSL